MKGEAGMERSPLVITGWDAISPYGIGKAELKRAMSGSPLPVSELRPLLDEDETAPFARCHTAAAFDTREFLGKKGTRTLDRLTGLAIATVGLALKDAGIGDADDRDRIGIVVGSSQGSLKSIAGFTRETLIHERPEFVNPALFPNTVMNCVAGQTAIWHHCRGPNVTVSAGHLSAIAAIRFAIRALQRGYADTFVAGGAEELTAPNAWAYYLTASSAGLRYAPLSEGCAMFTMATAEAASMADNQPCASVLGASLATYDAVPGAAPAVRAAALAEATERLLRECRVAPGDISVVCTSEYEPELADLENIALEHVFGPTGARLDRIAVSKLLGNSISASTAFQLALLLVYMDGATVQPRLGLLLAAEGSGSVGCLLVKSGG